MKVFLRSKSRKYYEKFSDALPLRLISVLIFIIGLLINMVMMFTGVAYMENNIKEVHPYSLVYIIAFFLALVSMIITLILANSVNGRTLIIFFSVPCCIAILTSFYRIFTNIFSLTDGIKAGTVDIQMTEMGTIFNYIADRKEGTICIAILLAFFVVLYLVITIKNALSKPKAPMLLVDATFLEWKGNSSTETFEKETKIFFKNDIVPIYPLSTLISIVMVFISLGVFLCSWYSVLFNEKISGAEIYVYAALSLLIFLIASIAYNSGRYSVKARGNLTIVLLSLLIARIIICKPVYAIEIFENALKLNTKINPVIILIAELVIPAFYIFFVYIYQQVVIKKSGYKSMIR